MSFYSFAGWGGHGGVGAWWGWMECTYRCAVVRGDKIDDGLVQCRTPCKNIPDCDICVCLGGGGLLSLRRSGFCDSAYTHRDEGTAVLSLCNKINNPTTLRIDPIHPNSFAQNTPILNSFPSISLPPRYLSCQKYLQPQRLAVISSTPLHRIFFSGSLPSCHAPTFRSPLLLPPPPITPSPTSPPQAPLRSIPIAPHRCWLLGD